MTSLYEDLLAFIVTNCVVAALIIWGFGLGVTASIITITCAIVLALSMFYIENLRAKKSNSEADKKLNILMFFATAIVWWLVVCWLFDLNATSSLIALAIAFPVSFVSVFLTAKWKKNEHVRK